MKPPDDGAACLTRATQLNAYFNHAAGSIPTLSATRAWEQCGREVATCGAADPRVFERWIEELVEVRQDIAQLVGAAGGHEIALTSSGTDAINRLAQSIAWRNGDSVVLPESEFISNMGPWLRLRKRGVAVRLARTYQDGLIDLQHLCSLVSPQTRLVTVSHTPNSIGALQMVGEIGAIAAQQGALFHLNACPTIGQIPINVAELGCHFLSGTSRKYLRGPIGGGFLYVDERAFETLQPAAIGWMTGVWDAGSNSLRAWHDARMLQDGHPLFPDWLGLGAAVREIGLLGGIEVLATRIAALVEYALQELGCREEVVVYGPKALTQRAALMTFNVLNRPAAEVAQFLYKRGVVVEAGDFMCPVPLARNGVSEAVRMSVHYTNSKSEIDLLMSALDDLINEHAPTR